MQVCRHLVILLLASLASGSSAAAQYAEDLRVGAHQAVAFSARDRISQPTAATTFLARRPDVKSSVRAGLIGAAIGGIVGGFVLTRSCEHECSLARGLGIIIGVPVGFMLGVVAHDLAEQPRRRAVAFPG
jgi:hypothetical protein